MPSVRSPFFLVVSLALAGGAAGAIGACDSDVLAPPPPCTGPTCTCEQDPQQPRCRGFSPPDNPSLEGGGGSDAPFAVPDAGDAGDLDADAGDLDAEIDAGD